MLYQAGNVVNTPTMLVQRAILYHTAKEIF